jgi:hypothetical protein
MKRLLIILVLVLTFTIPQLAIAGFYATFRYQWDQDDTPSDLHNWGFWTSNNQGGPYKKAVDVPFDGVNYHPTFDKEFYFNPGTQACVVVDAVDISGNRSEYSNEVCVVCIAFDNCSVKDTVSPNAPINNRAIYLEGREK